MGGANRNIGKALPCQAPTAQPWASRTSSPLLTHPTHWIPCHRLCLHKGLVPTQNPTPVLGSCHQVVGAQHARALRAIGTCVLKVRNRCRRAPLFTSLLVLLWPPS